MFDEHAHPILGAVAAPAKPVHHLPVIPLLELAADRPAQHVKFRYGLRSRVLSGGLSEVYQGYDGVRDRPCWVKIMAGGVHPPAGLVQRFLHEAEILSRLCHPNIVEAYECNRDEQGHPFIVLEPLSGRDLRSLLAEVSIVPLDRARSILRAVGVALQHAHDLGVVHLAINPDTIFLHDDHSHSGKPVEGVKLLDFGMARQVTHRDPQRERELPQDLNAAATPYRSPEALEPGGPEVDARSDQWSLAVVAYQMLTGTLPFWDNDPVCLRDMIQGGAEPVPLQQLLPDLPACVLNAVSKALSKDKEERFATISDFLQTIDGVAMPASRTTRPELRTDLIEQCRLGEDAPQAGEPAHDPDRPTAEYPVLTLPEELLASADRECVLEPLGTADKTVWPQPGASRRLLLAITVGLALLSAPVLAAIVHLHAAQPPENALPSAAPAAPAPPPGIVVSPLAAPGLLPVDPAALPARAGTVRTHRSARFHSDRPLAPAESESQCPTDETEQNKAAKEQLQRALAEGLGL